jgi:hypothetical protein
LERYDGGLLLGRRRGHLQEPDNLLLPIPQLIAEVGRERTGGRTAPQPITLDPDLDVLSREAGEKVGDPHHV